MATLTVQVGDRQKTFEIDTDIMFVGSAEEAEIRIRGQGVGERHCQIIRAGETYRLVDLGAGVTQVNGQPIQQHGLSDGDVITIGKFRMNFTAAPAAAPSAPSARPRASAPARGAAARGRPSPSARRSGGPGSRTRSRAAPAAPSRAVAGGEQRIVRQRSRKGGLPAPAVYGLVAVCVLSLSAVVYKVVTKESVDVLGLVAQANQLRDLEKYDLALQAITTARNAIDESHDQWSYVDRLYTELSTHRQSLDEMHEESAESTQYLSNIKPFWEKYIDISAEEADARSELTSHIDDPATARYFVEYRLQPYLDRFPSGANRGQVQSWTDQLKRRYKTTDPFPGKFWDVEVISTFESRLEHYGASYSVIANWKAAHPGTEDAREIDDKLALELERGTTYWEKYIVENKMQPAIQSKNFSGALRWAKKGWENLRGIPQLEGPMRQKINEIVDLAAKQNYKVVLDDFEGL